MFLISPPQIQLTFEFVISSSDAENKIKGFKLETSETS